MDIKQYYEKVVKGNRYDMAVAIAHNSLLGQIRVTAKDVPALEYKFICKNHVGSCLHYSASLVYLLHEAGYRAYICTTANKKLGTHHCLVLYFDEEGKYYIADPEKDLGNGNNYDNMQIDYDTFLKNEEGNEIAFYDVYGEFADELFFSDTFDEKCKVELSALI